MDYSRLPSDLEHQADQSPWGSSSPQADRTSFARTSSDAPSSPTPQRSPYTPEPENGHKYPPVSTDIEPANGADYSPEDDVRSPDLSEQLQSAQLGDPDYIGEQPPASYQQHIAATQNVPAGQARYQTSQATRPPRHVPQYKLQAKITALERSGRKDPVLRFDVHTNLPKFRTTQFRDVRRTHPEFVKLADHLISSNPEAMVPAVPPAVTSAGAGTEEDEARVKSSMQRWLNTVCSNDVLMRDDEMVFFVESDFGYSPVVRMKQPATGVRRKMLKQFAPPPDDTPELQAARPIVKLFYLGSLDTGQKLEKVVKSRRGLGLAENDLGVKLTQMNVQETHPGLANAYRKLGRVVQATGDFHAAQGTAEATTLGDPLAYHSSDAFIVKETLTNRHILLREYLQAQQAARSRETAANRLKASSSVKREKVDEAISALDEALSQENYLKGKTARVTANLLLEKRRWFQRTADDLKASLREYVLREIDAERRTLATLESIRMDIRAIDASGGLSRLGREAHPTVRRSSLASSQGPKGDAWSGVPRRTGDGLNRSISGSTWVSGNIPEVPGEEGDDAADNDDETTETENGGKTGRRRGHSSAGSGLLSPAAAAAAAKQDEDDDQDRIDAKNAASRLAQSTF